MLPPCRPSLLRPALRHGCADVNVLGGTFCEGGKEARGPLPASRRWRIPPSARFAPCRPGRSLRPLARRCSPRCRGTGDLNPCPSRSDGRGGGAGHCPWWTYVPHKSSCSPNRPQRMAIGAVPTKDGVGLGHSRVRTQKSYWFPYGRDTKGTGWTWLPGAGLVDRSIESERRGGEPPTCRAARRPPTSLSVTVSRWFRRR